MLLTYLYLILCYEDDGMDESVSAAETSYSTYRLTKGLAEMPR